jgi:hypothetical protein
VFDDYKRSIGCETFCLKIPRGKILKKQRRLQMSGIKRLHNHDPNKHIGRVRSIETTLEGDLIVRITVKKDVLDSGLIAAWEASEYTEYGDEDDIPDMMLRDLFSSEKESRKSGDMIWEFARMVVERANKELDVMIYVTVSQYGDIFKVNFISPKYAKQASMSISETSLAADMGSFFFMVQQMIVQIGLMKTEEVGGPREFYSRWEEIFPSTKEITNV